MLTVNTVKGIADFTHSLRGHNVYFGNQVYLLRRFLRSVTADFSI